LRKANSSKSGAAEVGHGSSPRDGTRSEHRSGPVRLPLTQLYHPRDPHRSSIDAERISALAADIAAHGLLQPIGVIGPDSDHYYEIAFGDRRVYAHELLRYTSIDAYVWPRGTDPLDIRSSENTMHEPLPPLDEAAIAARFRDQGLPLAHIAHKMGHTQTWVGGRLLLLDYPADLRAAIDADGLPLAVAAVLAQIANDAYRQSLIAEAIRTGANSHTAAVWLAHWRVDGARLEANHATIEAITQNRDQYRLMVECEGCHASVELKDTHSLRFCAGCISEVNQAAHTA
jgi:ParB/RepB/Spo0J family partition protein